MVVDDCLYTLSFFIIFMIMFRGNEPRSLELNALMRGFGAVFFFFFHSVAVSSIGLIR